MRATRSGWIVCSVALVLLAGVGVARAQEDFSLPARMPGDTIAYISIKNPVGREGYAESALARIIEEPEIKRFLADALPLCWALVERQAQSDRSGQIFLAAAGLMDREFTVAFAGVRMAPERGAVPALVISLDFSTPPDVSEKKVLTFLQQTSRRPLSAPAKAFEVGGTPVMVVDNGRMAVHYAFVGNRMLMATSPQDISLALAPTEACLANVPAFQEAMKAVGGDGGVLTAYVDVQRALAMQGMTLAQVPGLEDLGLETVTAAALSSRFADGGVRDTLYLHAPGQRAGLLKAYGPCDRGLLRFAPQNVRFLDMGQSDMTSAFDMLMAQLSRQTPEFEEACARLKEQHGVDVRDDLLALLGPNLMFYHAPYETAFVVEIAADNQPKLDAALAKLAEASGGNAEIIDVQHEGVRIRSLALRGGPAPINPSYAFADGYVLIAMYPQTIKSILTRVKAGGPTVLDNEDFQRVCGGEPAGRQTITYCDLGESLVGLYDAMLLTAPALYGVEEARSLSPASLPSIEAIRPHVFGLGVEQTDEANGLRLSVFSPFGTVGIPLAALGAMRTVNGGATVPILAAMLMPALARARSTARRIACISQLKNLGISFAFYMDDHEMLPAGPAALLADDYVDGPDMLVCPTDSAPMRDENGVLSSYYFVGEMSTRLPSDAIVVYDKRGNHPGGRNCLFLDYHVEFLSEDRFREHLRRNLGVIKGTEAWRKLTPARKAEVEKFYAGDQ